MCNNETTKGIALRVFLIVAVFTIAGVISCGIAFLQDYEDSIKHEGWVRR